MGDQETMSRKREQELLAEAATDPWSATQELQTHELAIEQEKTRQVEAGYRNERRKMLLSGVGYVLAGLAVLAAFALFLGLFYGWHRADQQRQRQVQVERTEQMRACLQLEGEAERQLCILGSGQRPLDTKGD